MTVRLRTPLYFYLICSLLKFRKATVDQRYQAGNSGILVLSVRNQGNGHILCDSERQYAQEAFGIHFAIVFFDPDRAFISVRLLNKKVAGLACRPLELVIVTSREIIYVQLPKFMIFGSYFLQTDSISHI